MPPQELTPPREKINLKLNPCTLSFREKQKHLERLFLTDYFLRSLKHLRFCHVSALFFYGVTGILEVSIVPEARNAIWAIRYGFVIPLFIAGLIFSYSSHYQKWWQILDAIYIIATGGGFIAMLIVGPKPHIYGYYVGVIICLFFGYTFIRERFVLASVSGCLLIISYTVVSLFIIDTPFEIFFHNFTYLNIANFLGMIICYYMERSARWDYLLTHLYNEEREKVERANLDLEKRVEERTIDIVKANQRLKEEMEAHLRAEKDKRELQTQLQRAQKMESLGTLAGGVAHDLNNILTGIVSYPDLMLSDILEESPIRQGLLIIKKSGEKAAAIVNDLLTLARRGVSVSEVVNLNLLIEDYLKSPEFEKLKAYHPHVEVRLNLHGGLANVIGSPIHLSKAIMNMVSNAAEAMPDSGTITISTRNQAIQEAKNGYMRIESGQYVTLEVTDTGVGISPEDLERIFEPFYSKKIMGRSGTGLGMAVVWGTVQDHKGFIDVKSTAGKGTSFFLYFPPTDELIQCREESLSIEVLKGHGESILVVDDVEEQREIASKILEKLGYSVTTCGGGEEAVKFLENNSADLIILDMIMAPGMDGLETYREIIELHPNQKAIIASGFSETDRVRELQRMGAGEYIRKPYSLERIGLSVRKALSF